MDSQIKRRRSGVNSLAGWQEEIRRCPLPFYSVLSLKQKGKKNLSSCRRPLQKNRSKSNIILGVINLVFMSFATRRETRLTIAKLIHLMLHSEIKKRIVSVPVFRTQFIQSVSSPRTPVPSEHIRFSRPQFCRSCRDPPFNKFLIWLCRLQVFGGGTEKKKVMRGWPLF